MIWKGFLPNAIVTPNNVPGILNIFEPVLLPLNILGTCPLTRRNRNFGIHFKNWRTTIYLLIGSLGILRWFLFTWMLGLRRSFMGYKAPVYVKTLVDKVRSLETHGINASSNAYDNFTLIGSHFAIPAMQILEILFCWAHSPAFGRFLNGFSKLEKIITEFSNELNLPTEYLNRIRKHRNIACLAIFGCGASLAFIYGWNAEKTGSETVGIILVVLSCGHFVFVPLIEDLKVTLSYKSLAEILYEVFYYKLMFTFTTFTILQNIQLIKVPNYGAFHSEVQNLLVFTERSWNPERKKQRMKTVRQIILAVREQSLVYVVVTTYGLKWQDDMAFRVKILCAGYGSVQIARVSLKGMAAEDLGRQESQLATKIISLTTSEQNDDIAFEAKLTHDMLVQNPIRISLGGIVIVNKALNLKIRTFMYTLNINFTDINFKINKKSNVFMFPLIQIMSLVVTYLIVLSQYAK
ncbi:unnamed protein product [Allacma fusca]|uniref:Uncharacterized protein n=1 Tax=Allacma fusca TaxID=39272 RepID=A0A8J2L5Q7_9HEXA|nr:unnamed protein product [Allacma fusca]